MTGPDYEGEAKSALLGEFPVHQWIPRVTAYAREMAAQELEAMARKLRARTTDYTGEYGSGLMSAWELAADDLDARAAALRETP